MKLLFDENLPLTLVDALGSSFPGSQHVHSVGLDSASDEVVWSYARDNGFTIVSKDSDFHERSLVFGYPPKVVWIRRGNCSTTEIEQMLRHYTQDMLELDLNSDAGFLILR